MKDNLSKRADLEYRKLAFALNQETPAAELTWEQVWNTICDKTDIGGSLETTKKRQSVFELYKGDNVVHEFSWQNTEVFDETSGNWDWVKILREVLGYVVKNKLVKKPRLKRSDAGKPKAKKVSKPKKKPAKRVEPAAQISTEYPADIIELFYPVKNPKPSDLTPVEVERWKEKFASTRMVMYKHFRNFEPWKQYLPKFFATVKAMRAHGINKVIKTDWIKKEVGLPLD